MWKIAIQPLTFIKFQSIFTSRITAFQFLIIMRVFHCKNICEGTQEKSIIWKTRTHTHTTNCDFKRCWVVDVVAVIFFFFSFISLLIQWLNDSLTKYRQLTQMLEIAQSINIHYSLSIVCNDFCLFIVSLLGHFTNRFYFFVTVFLFLDYTTIYFPIQAEHFDLIKTNA